MSVGSFSAGLSGLNANAQALSVIGNNLANINTVGFKASQISFRDMVYELAGANSENPAQIGLGVGVAAITPVFSQGSVESTRTATNVAIQGNGFFMLNGADGVSYTRAGAFTFDAAGTLVSPDGQKVQGYTTLDPVTKTGGHVGRARRHRRSAEHPAGAGGDLAVFGNLQPECPGAGWRHVHDVRSDLRLARRRPYGDDDLHKYRGRVRGTTT